MTAPVGMGLGTKADSFSPATGTEEEDGSTTITSGIAKEHGISVAAIAGSFDCA